MEKQDAPKNFINPLHERNHDENPDSPKASTGAQTVTVNNISINNSIGVIVGDNSTMMDNTFKNLDSAAAGDNHIQPRMLEDELRLQARLRSQEILPPPIELERPIVPVSLQIAKEPVRIPNAFDADGHLHRRKDIVKFYEHPPGDISEEEMFDLPKQQVQQEAKWKNFEYEADKTEYIRKHGNILAVIGWPGIGKTTSMKKWLRQILKGKLVPGVTYVFFIFVRHIDFSKKMNVFQFLLSTIIDDWDHSTESDKAWLKKLFSDPNVFIALEGIDESAVNNLTMRAPKLSLYDTADPLDIMLNLMGGKLLPLARIVISSRPDELFHLHPEHRPKCIVQILGLNKDAQNELGHQIWEDRYERVKVILEKNPHTFAYCFVPVNFLLTADYLMSESEEESEEVCMTRVLASACKKYAVSDHLHHKECDLDKLSKLAWNGHKKMKVVFKEADLEEANIDKNTMESFLNRSVVTSADIKMTIMDGDKRSSFSHLIWQEFMVAVHLLHYCTDDFDQHLLDIHEDRWEVIAKFLFGLCNNDVFDIMKCFKGSCSEDQWIDKRDQLKKVAIRRMKSLNQQLTARQDAESSQNRSSSVTVKPHHPIVVPQLNQSLTTSQSQQLSSNQLMSNQPLCYPSYPIYQPMENHYHQSAESLPEVCGNKYPPLAGSSHQQLGFNLDKQLTANPYSQPLADQHQLLLTNQCATNTNQQVPANFHKISPGSPLFHPASTNYQQVAANSYQGFASNQPYPVKLHHSIASQAPKLSPNQVVSGQPLRHPSYSSYQPVAYHRQQCVGSQYPLAACNRQQPMANQNEQLRRNQGWPTFETSHQQLEQQLHQNRMSNQSHQFPSNQIVSSQHWHHSSHPGPRHMVNHFHRQERIQHLLPQMEQMHHPTSPEDQQPTNKYPPLDGSSYQHLRLDRYKQLTANPYSQPLTDQHQLLLANQFATNTNQQVPANFHKISPGSPLFHPASTNYQQVAANSYQGFASNQPYPVKLHHSIASQAPKLSPNQVVSGQPLRHPSYSSYQPVAYHRQQCVGSQYPLTACNRQQPMANQNEQLRRNQGWPTFETSHQQLEQQLHQNRMSNQSHQFPSNQIVSSQHWHHPSHPGPRHMVDHFHRQERTQHLLPKMEQMHHPTSPEDQQPTNKYPPLDGSSHQHLRLDHYKQLTANPYSEPLADQQQLSLASQCQPLATNNNQQFPAHFHKISPGNPSFHSASMHYQQVAASSDQEFASTKSAIQHLQQNILLTGDKWKPLLQVCSWIHEANEENITRDVVAHLPDHIEFPRNTTIIPSDVSDLFYALRSSPKSHTLEVIDCSFSGDSLKLFSKEVSSSNIKIQRFYHSWEKLNDGDFSSVVEILQHVEEELVLYGCGITSCQVSSLAEKFSETGHKLEFLNLSHNKLIGDGARSLIPCLHLIEKLVLDGCNVTEAVEEEIRSELKRLDLPEHRVYF